MKQYVIDELRTADYKALKIHLEAQYGPAAIGGVYWIPIDRDLLSETQKAHRACQPHYVAVVLDEHRMACEFLVRTKTLMRCDCIGYATHAQRSWLMAQVDHIFNQLKIMT